MADNEITQEIIGCAMEVHKFLGPGLLESAYEECLAHELETNGLRVQKQVPIPVVYKDVKPECGYRVDLLVDFNVTVLKDGIRRYIMWMTEELQHRAH